MRREVASRIDHIGGFSMRQPTARDMVLGALVLLAIVILIWVTYRSLGNFWSALASL
jgi:hypothetical protein